MSSLPVYEDIEVESLLEETPEVEDNPVKRWIQTKETV